VEHTPVVEGRPPSAAELEIAESVTSANWIDPPFNRYGYLHVRDLTRTALVAAGAPRPLPEQLIGADELGDFLDVLHATYTDACVVVHRGHVVFEYYDTGVLPTDRHLLMSVSKSLTAALVGQLVDEGLLRVDQEVTEFLPELTEWRGCTLQHLLDMRAGIRFDEFDMDDMDCPGVLLEQVSGYTTRRRDDIPADTAAWIRELPAVSPHGVRYEYRSILTSVLGWIVEVVTGERIADLFSRRIWSRIGAEHDADLIVDVKGFPVVEGGFCTTARDLARFGLMHLQGGRIGHGRIVSPWWVDRVLERDQRLVDDFRAGHDADPTRPDAYYHDGWWVFDAASGRYSGLGLGDQRLMIDRSTETVIAKLSSTPKRLDPLLGAHAQAGIERLLDLLAERDPRRD
jgi:CubicO group peptidase (beta-lactamase class C family)